MLYKNDSYGRNPYFQYDVANQSWGEVDEFTIHEHPVKTGELTKEEQEARDYPKTYRFDNYDVSTIITGHLDYRKKLDLLFDYINF
jgi:hypothetical protein